MLPRKFDGYNREQVLARFARCGANSLPRDGDTASTTAVVPNPRSEGGGEPFIGGRDATGLVESEDPITRRRVDDYQNLPDRNR